MRSIYLLTAVDVRRADEPGTSRANQIAKLALPKVELQTADHNPGGGVMEINAVLPRAMAFEPKFDGKGIDTDIFSAMATPVRWTFAGAYREQKPGGGGMVAGRAIIEGIVSAWEPDESDPAAFQGCTHTFSEITHYEFTLGDTELFYVDFWERVLRTGGIDHFAAVRQALGA